MPQIQAAPAHLPGREERAAEPARLSPSEIAVAIAERADRPYGLYGHSLGGRLGFEVIRELIRLGAPPPVVFFPAAVRPPDVNDPIARSVLLADDDFLGTLIDRLGAPTELAEVPELGSMFLPLLRSDFRWVHEYRYQPAARLPVPIVALAGAQDQAASPAAMVGWQRMTSARFSLRTLADGHLFMLDDARKLCELLSAELLAAARRLPEAAGGPQARCEPGPPADEMHVWAASLDDLPGAAGAWAALPPGQALHAARLRDRQIQRRYVAACAFFRWVLRRYGVLDVADGAGVVDGPGYPDPAGRMAASGQVGGLRAAVSQANGRMLVGVTGAGHITVRITDSGAGGADGELRLRYAGLPWSVHAPGASRLRFEAVTAGAWLAAGGAS